MEITSCCHQNNCLFVTLLLVTIKKKALKSLKYTSAYMQALFALYVGPTAVLFPNIRENAPMSYGRFETRQMIIPLLLIQEKTTIDRKGCCMEVVANLLPSIPESAPMYHK